jgi:CheY-like chemotaxis protein
MTLPFCQLRILVAENDVATRKLISLTLKQMSMAVVCASNGKQALAKFTAEHFDLIFMALAMPKLDGFAATAAIRHHENAFDDRVPIIAMTNLRNSNERERCLTAGMDSYLEKPGNSGQIQTVLLAFTDPDSLQPAKPPPKWTRLKALERHPNSDLLLLLAAGTQVHSSRKLLFQPLAFGFIIHRKGKLVPHALLVVRPYVPRANQTLSVAAYVFQLRRPGNHSLLPLRRKRKLIDFSRTRIRKIVQRLIPLLFQSHRRTRQVRQVKANLVVPFIRDDRLVARPILGTDLDVTSALRNRDLASEVVGHEDALRPGHTTAHAIAMPCRSLIHAPHPLQSVLNPGHNFLRFAPVLVRESRHAAQQDQQPPSSFHILQIS